MDFKDAGLHECDHAVEILDGDDLIAVVAQSQNMTLVKRRVRVLLKKALSARAVRAAQQRQRPPDHMRRHVVPDVAVVVGKFLLGDADILPVNAVRMGELDRALCRRSARGLARNRLGALDRNSAGRRRGTAARLARF